MKVKDLFLSMRSLVVRNGKQLRFWEDKWIGNQSFMYQYMSLYQNVRKKSDTVAHVLNRAPLNVYFCRALVGHNLSLWYNLVSRLIQVQLTEETDSIRWNLTSTGSFTI
jgi:hypothetical protein